MDDIYYHNYNKLNHNTRLLRVCCGECNLNMYIILDGIYKNKLWFNETYYKNESCGEVLVNSFVENIYLAITK